MLRPRSDRSPRGEPDIHATLTTIRRYAPLFGAGVFFLVRCVQSPALVSTPVGLAAVLVGTAIVFVLLSGVVVLARVGRRFWSSLPRRTYTTADTTTGNGDERGGR